MQETQSLTNPSLALARVARSEIEANFPDPQPLPARDNLKEDLETYGTKLRDIECRHSHREESAHRI
jgi:hypothetical protein